MESNPKRVSFGLVACVLSLVFLISLASQSALADLDDYTEYEWGDIEVELSGRFMYDYDSFDGVYTEDGLNESDSELRRARLGFEADYNDWRLNYSAEYNDQESSYDTKNAYIRYSGFDFGNITLGRSKEPFGLERMTSSRHIASIERSMASDAFTPGRNLGLKLTRNAENYSFTTGIFEAEEDQGTKTGRAWTTRFTAIPWQSHDSMLHVGLAASLRDLDGARFDIDEPAEVHTASDIVISDNINDADTVDLTGLELAFASGPFSLQGEYFQADVESEDQNAEYSGSYILGGYFLTGESRRYRNGEFGRVQPSSNMGAWELVARYSELDAYFDGEGDRANVLTLGVNYHSNEHFKVMANYLDTEVTEEASSAIGGEAFSLRAQFSF